MVSSGVINGDISSIKTIFSSYDSTVSGLAGSWSGDSHDNFESKASEFSSSCSNTVISQLNNLASACDLYEQYIQTKNSLVNAENSYREAVAQENTASQATLNQQIAELNSQKTELKSKIESLLSSVASQHIEASSNSASVSVSGGSGINKNWTDDANFAYFNQSGGWGDYRYSSGGKNTMGASGCGPTAMAMVMTSLGYDVNPSKAADWSADHGYHSGGGTDHGFFTSYANEMGITNKELNVSNDSIKTALSNGDLVILNVAPGDFTNYGHFIVARGYDTNSDRVLIADPNHTSNNAWWDLTRVTNQTKGCWAYSNKQTV